MYRINNFTSATDAFHFLISTLVHRAGWTLVDGYINSIGYLVAWPGVTESPVIANNDFAVLKAPDVGLAGCGDHVHITYLSATPSVDIASYRRADGTLPAWDNVGHALFDIPSTITLSKSVDLSNTGGKQFVMAEDPFFVFAHMDVTGNALFDGTWSGYLRTTVLDATTPTPVLGTGPDPFPLTLIDLLLLSGNVISGSATSEDIRLVIDLKDAATNDATDNPVDFGTVLPRHILAPYIGIQDPPVDPHFTRGILPGIFRTSSVTSLSLLRLPATGSEFLVLAAKLAAGPLA